MIREVTQVTIITKQALQDYIMATYGRKNPGGLSGAETFGVTSANTGFTN